MKQFIRANINSDTIAINFLLYTGKKNQPSNAGNNTQEAEIYR